MSKPVKVEESKEQLASPSLSATTTKMEPVTTTLRQPSANHTNTSTGTSNDNDSDLLIRPHYNDLINPRLIESLLSSLLADYFATKVYDPNESINWCKELSVTIKNRLKELNLPRYKYLVQVMIGENRGAGVRCGCRCLWDSQTDKLAQASYSNDSLYCIAAAFGVYLY